MVARYGEDTAFFSTNCAMQIPLITGVVNSHAIYPQPCCPSPYHAFPGALGIEAFVPSGEVDRDGNPIMRLRDLSEVVEEIRNELRARGVAGRLSTWPAPASMMWTTIGAEYAIRWINGDVPQNDIDISVLAELAAAYSLEVTGEPVGIEFENFTLDGVTFPNFVLGVMDYLTF
jgi:hypothetical protein